MLTEFCGVIISFATGSACVFSTKGVSCTTDCEATGSQVSMVGLETYPFLFPLLDGIKP